MTDHERATLEACSQMHVVTLPGAVTFLPNEAPHAVAELITQALAAA